MADMNLKMKTEFDSTNGQWGVALTYTREDGRGASHVTGFGKTPTEAAVEAMSKLLKGQKFEATF